MNSLDALFARCLLGIYWWMGLVPLPPVSQLLWLLLALVIRLIWVSYFMWMLWTGISYVLVDRSMSVSYLTGSILFIGYSMLGLLIQAQTIFKQRSYVRLEDYRIQLELQMSRLSSSHYGHKSGRLLFLLGTHLASDIIKSWANSKYSISPVHIVSMMQKWQLRFHFIQLMRQIMELNQRAIQLRHSLLRLAAGNDLWLPYKLSDFKHLQTLRLSYERIYECHELFNDCYGWGMLCLQLLCSFEFVANAYWFITEAYDSQRLYIFIFNGNTCFTIGSLVTALFWYGDASANNSRQIGCLIPKLVKPLGSKRYNDLVSEFLLQTLHQRFVVTAKDFFSLNLHLLSSMFGAVVTYLVILIQFMFAEKSAQAAARPK
ncbi:gustatory receptor 23a [Drosophila mojavensis]|uniref:Gustatory receptor n=1 Tax=Drosophila mojavensis TaxID=7230 RepID=B4KL51_DROMO|nr:gustatory receptor 23a [Drosophila mojavensis]EDW12801.2 uncharacterized protein Dmoj_GI17872 [Drosophila mojavensis]